MIFYSWISLRGAKMPNKLQSGAQLKIYKMAGRY